MTKKSRIEHQALKATSISFTSIFISIVLQLISVPICLHYWGKTVYGAWLALSAAFTIMRTVDGGYTTFIGNKLNILYHLDDQKLRLTLASSVWGVIILGSVQICILIILYLTNSMSIIMDSSTTSSISSTQSMLGLMVMSITWMFTCSFIGILHRFLIPVGMLSQLLWWMMLLQVAQYLSLICAAYLQFNVFEAALLFAFTQAAVYLSSAFYIKNKLPIYYPWLKNSKLSIGARDIIRSLPMTLNGMAQQAGNSGVIVLVSSLLGMAAVPAYSTLRTLTNLWTVVTNIVTGPLLPHIIKYYAKADWQKLLMVHRVHLLLMNIMINLSLMIVFPFIDNAYSIWTRHKLVMDHQLLCFLFASISIFALNSLINTFLTGLNHGKYLIVSAVFRGCFILPVGWILVSYFHLMGIGIAIFISESILLFTNSFIFFKQELINIGCNKYQLFSVWDIISFGIVVLFFIISALFNQIHLEIYFASLVILISSIIFSFINLDAVAKSRIIQLLQLSRKRS